jgi:hypothetical protein
MPLLIHPTTNSASNRDWLRASKAQDMTMYGPGTTTHRDTRTAAGARENTPFSAVHPDVAGRRNPVRAADEESITLGPARKIGPRQHTNGRTLLRAKKK